MPISIAEASKIRTKPTPLDDPWFKFLGELPLDKGWNGTVFGPSFNGKSVFVLYFGMALSQFGDVLYVNVEEDSPKGTIQNKINKNDIRALKYNYDFADTTDLAEINKMLDSGKYKYVIRDSIHALALHNDMKPLHLWREFKKWPDISFIDVLFSMKDEKNFKGESDILHLSEFTVECRKNKAGLPIARGTRKNRYKQDPNKYQYLDFIHNKVLRTVIDE